MIVPEFWAESRRQHRDQRRQITVRRFGWSESSQVEAQQMADQRAEQALQAAVQGQTVERRERKSAYNGAAGVPIREEVLGRHGTLVITRNSYGAQCLNTPDTVFADVDFATEASWAAKLATVVILEIVAIIVAVVTRQAWFGGGLGLIGLMLASPLANAGQRLIATFSGGVEQQTRRRLQRFLEQHPDWNVRIYRTPAGWRLLATHQPLLPDHPDVAAFFRATSTDPIYVRMCLNQRCFRARLTPKPWRMGFTKPLKPRRGVWPVDAQRLPERQAWVADYEQRAAQFAACRFLESLGSGRVHPELTDTIEIHDRLSRSLTPDLPLG